MAHKKGVGSSKNGRESESKRWALRFLVAKLHVQEISLYANGAPPTTQEKMFT